jgi:DNA-binding beta-propeller fold protein YncE
VLAATAACPPPSFDALDCLGTCDPGRSCNRVYQCRPPIPIVPLTTTVTAGRTVRFTACGSVVDWNETPALPGGSTRTSTVYTLSTTLAPGASSGSTMLSALPSNAAFGHASASAMVFPPRLQKIASPSPHEVVGVALLEGWIFGVVPRDNAVVAVRADGSGSPEKPMPVPGLDHPSVPDWIAAGVDPSGAPTLFVADSGNRQILSSHVDASTRTPFRADLVPVPSTGSPVGIAATNDEVFFGWYDGARHSIRSWTLGATTSTVVFSGSTDMDCIVAVAPLCLSGGIAVDHHGRRIFVADSGTNTVRVIDRMASTATAAVIAGDGRPGLIDGQPGRFNYPRGLAIDAQDHFLFVAERGSSAIRSIDLLHGNVVATIVRASGTPLITTPLLSPNGLALLPSGDLLVSSRTPIDQHSAVGTLSWLWLPASFDLPVFAPTCPH